MFLWEISEILTDAGLAELIWEKDEKVRMR
jgi:hypothetical protein